MSSVGDFISGAASDIGKVGSFLFGNKDAKTEDARKSISRGADEAKSILGSTYDTAKSDYLKYLGLGTDTLKDYSTQAQAAQAQGLGALTGYGDKAASAFSSGLSSLTDYGTKATGALSDQSTNAMSVLKDYFSQAGSALSPLTEAGTSGFSYLKNLVDQPTELTEAYKYASGLGTEALNKELAARGLYDSGAAIEGQTSLQQGLLANLLGQRQSAASQLAGYGAAGAQGQSNLLSGLGGGLSNIYGSLGSGLSNIYSGLGSGALSAGSGLANLYGSLGSGALSSYGNLSSLLSNTGSNLASAYQGAGSGLANLGTSYGSSMASIADARSNAEANAILASANKGIFPDLITLASAVAPKLMGMPA